jgi:DNA-binding NtrC family response regulator
LTVDVRILAATNKDLLQEVKNGHFREDLYYRLNVIPIQLPPLSKRRNDIPLQARFFMERYATEQGKNIKEFSSEAMRLLLDYRWPGNVRELENAIERAVVLSRGETVEVDELPQALRGGGPPAASPMEFPPTGVDFRQSVAEYQEHLNREALNRCNGVQRRAAKLLKLSPTTLNEMIHRLGIEPDED